MEEDVGKKLIMEAGKILVNSYAPYSGIHVASAILADDGGIYRGVNVENSSLGLTICAERSAISAMITAGARKPLIVAIVTDYEHPIPPCGACRQVIAEFNPEAEIIMHSVKSGETIRANLKQLFPTPFTLKS